MIFANRFIVFTMISAILWTFLFSISLLAAFPGEGPGKTTRNLQPYTFISFSCNWLLAQPWHISVEMQSAFAYRMLPSFCFASYNSMLHSVLKLILNSRDMKTTFFLTWFATYCCANCCCTIRTNNCHQHFLSWTCWTFFLSYFGSNGYRKENHVLFSQRALQRKFCERSYFRGFLNTEHNLVPRSLLGKACQGEDLSRWTSS